MGSGTRAHAAVGWVAVMQESRPAVSQEARLALLGEIVQIGQPNDLRQGRGLKTALC